MYRTAVAGITAAVGIGAQGIIGATHIILAAGTAGPADYVTSVGGVSAAAALVYIVKQMVDGKLVARDPARVERDQSDQVRQLADLLAQSHEREDRLRDLYQSAIGGKQ